MQPDVFQKRKKAWKQFQNKLYIMNATNNGENAKLIELRRHGSFLLQSMCKTLWCFTRWTVSPLSHTLKIRNFFLPAHKQAPARAWQRVCVIYQQETLSSQNSCLTQSPNCGSLVFWKRWCLPWKDRHTIMGVLAGSCSGWMTDLHGWKMDLHNLLNIINSENSIWNA